MAQIVPAVLAYSEDEFDEKISHQGIRVIAPVFQVDILDGSMFDAECWADAKAASLYEPLPDIELHLMIANPVPVVETWKDAIPSVMRAIVHAEIDGPLMEVLDDIQRLGIETGIAISPDIELTDFSKEIERADLILIMGVYPGKSGQNFLGDSVLQKIRKARQLYPEKGIAVDGGVTLKNASSIINAGANQLCVSSTIWKAKEPSGALRTLQNLNN